eukprot:gnl/TRDRNA2_/TRDRNA2_138566_c1_seq2.p1 gnl/TRDRNA2_/TRDRNA2_138566_c1~~gnl/TRDRNA2_/TRDRNA2_138566_c1_seq2.p1  ORF type:complete len:204 (+),score=10.67 gnl/TRDRNA2_/TRDRNA2_138566_c1_seq2:69-680(+)
MPHMPTWPQAAGQAEPTRAAPRESSRPNDFYGHMPHMPHMPHTPPRGAPTKDSPRTNDFFGHSHLQHTPPKGAPTMDSYRMGEFIGQMPHMPHMPQMPAIPGAKEFFLSRNYAAEMRKLKALLDAHDQGQIRLTEAYEQATIIMEKVTTMIEEADPDNQLILNPDHILGHEFNMEARKDLAHRYKKLQVKGSIAHMGNVKCCC